MGVLARSLGLRLVLAILALTLLSAGAVLAAAPRVGGAARPAEGAWPAGSPAEAARGLDLTGWLRAVGTEGGSAARLQVVTPNGLFDVRVDGDSAIRRASDGAKLAVSDLAAAMPVIVAGEVEDDAWIQARVVNVGQLPPTTAAEVLSMRGRILATFGPSRATAERSLVVVTAARGEAVLEVDKDTVVLKPDGQRGGFGDLKAGQSVIVMARGTTQAVARAERLELSSSGRAPQVAVDGLLRGRGLVEKRGERWIVGEVLLWLPADLAASQRELAIGAQVSVSASRDEAGDLVAQKVRAVAKAARPQVVELRGRIEQLNAGLLVVDGNSVALTAQTAAPTALAVGQFVKVRARMETDGQLTADSVEVLDPAKVQVQFEGGIESVARDVWKVGRVLVHILDGVTVVSGEQPAVGNHAEVTGLQRRDGSVEALRIAVTASVTPNAWATVVGTLVARPPAPAPWLVEDANKIRTEVLVTDDTWINEGRGAAAVNAWIEVRGRRDAENRIVAQQIRVRGSAK